MDHGSGWGRRSWVVVACLLVASCATPATDDQGDVLMYKGGPGRTGEAGTAIPGEPSILWTVATDGPIDSSPAVRDGVAYVVGGDGRVLAIDVGSGAVSWTSAEAGHVGSPAIAGERIIVLGDDGSIAALDMAGATAWRSMSDLEAASAPLVMGDLVVAGGQGGAIQAFDVASGAPAWDVATGGSLPRAAAGDGSTAYIGSHDGRLYAVDLDGTTAWTLDVGADHFATPAVRDGTVYAAAALPDRAHLLAIDAATGEERWRFTPPDGSGLHSPSADASTVYISSEEHLYALSPDDGAVRWAHERDGWNTAGLTVTSDTLYSLVAGGTLYALDADTGEERWHLWVQGDVPTGTTLSQGRIIVGNGKGEVLAIGSSPG